MEPKLEVNSNKVYSERVLIEKTLFKLIESMILKELLLALLRRLPKQKEISIL
jgi:hypothetical protein